MNSLLDRLIRTADDAGLDCDGEDLADIVWLANCLSRAGTLAPSPRQAPVSDIAPPAPMESQQHAGVADPIATNPESLSTPLPTTISAPQQPESVPGDSSRANVHLPGAGGVEKRQQRGREFRAPAAAALPARLSLAKAMRPLMRRVNSRTELMFDEAETERRIAGGDVWSPVLVPRPARWFRLTLVVDRSRSMMIWRQTSDELYRTLEWTGAFRHLTRFALNADGPLPQLSQLHRKTRSARGSHGLPRDEQHLVLVLSDCVSNAWWNGAAYRLLEDWSAGATVALVQVLPESMWSRTSLGRTDSAQLKKRAAEPSNRFLQATAVDLWDDGPGLLGFRLPTLTLEAAPLSLWAAGVTRVGGDGFPGVVVPPREWTVPTSGPENASPAQSVERFRATASRTAADLAGLTAVSPVVSLQVIRLIRSAMLPAARQVHEAEVLLGGLLRQPRQAVLWESADDVHFEFHDGVAEELLKSVKVRDWSEVLRKVSEYAERHLGYSLSGFRAILSDEEQTEELGVSVSSPFVQLSLNRLEMLGGDWAERARRARVGLTPSVSSLPGAAAATPATPDQPQQVAKQPAATARYHRVVGIDLGTSYSSVAIFNHQTEKCEVIPNLESGQAYPEMTPSVVSTTPDKSRALVGWPAKKNIGRLETIVEFKRHMGQRFTEQTLHSDVHSSSHFRVDDPVKVLLAGQWYLPQEISALVLMKLKDIAEAYIGEEIQDAVITVPAYFAEPQRRATEEAAYLAGLYPRQLIPEPTAAAVSYGRDRLDLERRFYLVYDLGGGTFDVSFIGVQESQVEVLYTLGNARMGGADLDQVVLNWIIAQLRDTYRIDPATIQSGLSRIRTDVERAKRELSFHPSTELTFFDLLPGRPIQIELTRETLETLIEPLIRGSLSLVDQVLKWAEEQRGLRRDELDGILLVGGSTRIPLVKSLLLNFFGQGESFIRSVDSNSVVAQGAAYVALRFNPSTGPFDPARSPKGAVADHDLLHGIMLQLITEHSLGIGVQDDQVHRIVDRGTRIPASQRLSGFTNGGPVDFISVPIYQGDEESASKNTLIGTLQIGPMEPKPEGTHRFDVTFNLDVNGLLSVTVHHLNENKVYQAKIEQATGVGGVELLKAGRERLLNLYRGTLPTASAPPPAPIIPTTVPLPENASLLHAIADPPPVAPRFEVAVPPAVASAAEVPTSPSKLSGETSSQETPRQRTAETSADRRARLPNEAEMARLPRLAAIAYSAHCVRSIALFYSGWQDVARSRPAVQQAIGAAEEYAAGRLKAIDNSVIVAVQATAKKAQHTAEQLTPSSSPSHGPVANTPELEAWAAWNVAVAAANAASLNVVFALSHVQEAIRCHGMFNADGKPSGAIPAETQFAFERYFPPLWAEYDRLLAAALEGRWTDSTPVPPAFFTGTNEIQTRLAEPQADDERKRSEELRRLVESQMTLSKAFFDKNDFAAARKAILELPDQPSDLAQLKKDSLRQIGEGEKNYKLHRRIDTQLALAKELVTHGDIHGARKALHELPDDPAELVQLKKEALKQIDEAERIQASFLPKKRPSISTSGGKQADDAAQSSDRHADRSAAARLHFAIFGVPASGKTSWLAAFWQLVRHAVLPRAIKIECLSTRRSDELSRLVDQHLNKRIALNPAHLRRSLEPVSCRVAGRHSWWKLRRGFDVQTELRDLSGEFIGQSGSDQSTDHEALRADGFLYFLDPTESARHQHALLSQFCQLVRKSHGFSRVQRLDVPVAVCVSKFDLLLQREGRDYLARQWKQELHQSGSADDSSRLASIEHRSKRLLETLDDYWPAQRVRAELAESFGDRVRFFPMSMVGPAAQGGDNLSSSGATFGILEPYLWLVHSCGYPLLS